MSLSKQNKIMNSCSCFHLKNFLIFAFLFYSMKITGSENINYLTIQDVRYEREVQRRSHALDLISLGKWMLINGETKKARRYFEQIDLAQGELKELVQRYLSMIDFIQGEYETSLNRIEKSFFQRPEQFAQVCLQKILLRIITSPPIIKSQDSRNSSQLEEDANRLRRLFTHCRFRNQDYTKNFNYWLDNLEKISFGETSTLRGANISDAQFILQSLDLVRIWLKTALLTNNEQLIDRHLDLVPEEFYRYRFFRELIGMYYYRMGDSDLALNFIEGIDTPNADNIRGNIQLEKKQYELAFGHFQLALQKKSNSRNALERSIPLAWILEQWDAGQEMLLRLLGDDKNSFEKEALNSAFHIQKKDYDIADRRLRFIQGHYLNQTPLLVDMMISHVALINKNTDRMVHFAQRACLRGEMISCWKLHQNIIWDAFNYTIDREENIHRSYDLDELRRPKKIAPLNDRPYVNQIDIEELDSRDARIPFEVELESATYP